MGANTVSESLQHLFNKMEDFVSTKTVVGEPMYHGDITIVPLMDVSIGVGTGLASTTNSSPKSRDGGGGALGAKMTPVAMLVINDGNVQMVSVKPHETPSNKLIDMIPGILSKLNLGSWLEKKNKENTTTGE